MAFETVNSIGYTGKTPDSVVGLPFGLQNASVSDGEVSPFVTVSDLETKTVTSMSKTRDLQHWSKDLFPIGGLSQSYF